jgi:hypothetical protein
VRGTVSRLAACPPVRWDWLVSTTPDQLYRRDTMALSRLAREFAAEIANHDWSDAPYRADRAGHNRQHDNRLVAALSESETDTIRMNVMWVTAQVLGHQDPNFDVYEFAAACGVNTLTSRGEQDGGIFAGVRTKDGRYCQPGTWDAPPN